MSALKLNLTLKDSIKLGAGIAIGALLVQTALTIFSMLVAVAVGYFVNPV